MALTLPLFHRPGGVLFLDDDADYLDMLGMVIPAHWSVELYSRPTAFLKRMLGQPAEWEADAQLQLQMIERWRQGQALIPQVLTYWREQTQRFELAKTCVVDYAMPGMDGLSVLNTLLDWPGSRVLLTGQADEQIAIQAFNNGLIDQFVPKQSPDITRLLLSVMHRLAHTAHPRLNMLWRGALKPVQVSLLQIPSVAEALQSYTRQNWVEYVVIGEPFGLLGLDAQGHAHWLQLETASSLPELAEVAAAAALGMDVVQRIQRGESLVALELHQQLRLRGTPPPARAIPLGDDGLLRAAAFALDSAALGGPLPSYSDHLARHADRLVQDN